MGRSDGLIDVVVVLCLYDGNLVSVRKVARGVTGRDNRRCVWSGLRLGIARIVLQCPYRYCMCRARLAVLEGDGH